MDTWNSRLPVVKALEAAGWTGDPDHPLTLLRHPVGAAFGIDNESGDCGLDTPNGGIPAEFPANIPDAVVIAACLAASHQDPTAALGLELHEERQDHDRTRKALASAKRRAARRLPHEREGLIFHLERRNRRLEELVNLANATAALTAKAGEEAAAEAYSLRERVGHLQARVRDLETALKGHAPPCGRELSTGQGCPDHPRPEAATAPEPAGAYGPALPWARLMDAEDLEEFLAELTAAVVGRDGEEALHELEETCGRWRVIAEAQHAHNTAPGPDDTADVIAYRSPDRPGVLICRPHGDRWPGLTPLTADDLPDGGLCTFGRPGEECGVDVLIPQPPLRQSAI